jgi:hypothetical protein
MRPTNTTSIRVRLLPNVIVCAFLIKDFRFQIKEDSREPEPTN